jgi:uncharacterized protein
MIRSRFFMTRLLGMMLLAVLMACETTPTKTVDPAPPLTRTDPAKPSLDDAYTAYRANEDAKALMLFLPFARAGNRDAQIRIAYIYSRNKGVPKNPIESCNWWEAAAQGGDPLAATNIGLCFESGEGRGKSDTVAAQWYTRAAQGGNAYGMYNLGLAYEYGRGVAQSFATAAEWLRRALDTKLSTGDNVDAQRHLRRATNHVEAAKGNPQAQYDLAIDLMNGHEPEVKDQRRAMMMMREAATRGQSPEAWYIYGAWLQGGMGETKSDVLQAAMWTKKASDAGHEGARIRYANILRCGIGVKKDLAGGEALLKVVVDSGSWLAMSELAEWYNRGECGFKKDPALGQQWRVKADAAQLAESTRRTRP